MTRQYSNLVPRISPFPGGRKNRDLRNKIGNIPQMLTSFISVTDQETWILKELDLHLRCIRCSYEIFPEHLIFRKVWYIVLKHNINIFWKMLYILANFKAKI